ncbi:MAG: bifunctional glutamate N-acetyltransferase/amino-acid acetyltransferase ArgJ [Candidatus Altiarchaeota archaeon]
MEFKALRTGICFNGFKASGVRSGKQGVALITAGKACNAVGVFTRNRIKSGSVVYTRRKLRNGIMAVVVNSGNANCCTSTDVKDADTLASYASKYLVVGKENVAVSSTGIIGRRLNTKGLRPLIEKASEGLGCSGKKSLEAAKAIMTTDTKPKVFAYSHKGIIIGGICKGSGMIAPNMGTMLCFLTSNADLPRGYLKKALSEAVDSTFNMIVLDDMSTNDSVMLLTDSSKKCSPKDFKLLLTHVLRQFVKLMLEDAEGASKVLEVTIRGAKDVKTAGKAAKAVVSSNLVKTAFYGENPNWGRIANKLGGTIEVDFRKLDIVFASDRGRAYAVKSGRPQDIRRLARILKSKKIHVIADLKSGRSEATAWGCDLTPGYVKINAEYN